MSWIVTVGRRSSFSSLIAARTPSRLAHKTRRTNAFRCNHGIQKPTKPDITAHATHAVHVKATDQVSAKALDGNSGTYARPPLWNPFPFLAHTTENIDLASRLRSYSNTFGIIGALMCTLSITALTMMPVESIPDEGFAQIATTGSTPSTSRKLVKAREPSPILVKYFGVPKHHLEDAYIASWAASFYTSGIGLGLATLVAGIVAATAPAYVKIFVRRHSDILIALPIFQALSIGFAGVGLFLGLDETRGEPVSWIGLLGTAAGGGILTVSTARVLRGYHAARTAGKLSPPVPPKVS
ncbi:hypothetical protein MHU86_11788 [Fragilaria crotonensis]|nr:hypothetical protein MHU86_11788 [Fragilaria crotonensis]